MTDLLTSPFMHELRAERAERAACDPCAAPEPVDSSRPPAGSGAAQTFSESDMIHKTKPGNFAGCTPLTPAERMQRYSRRHAEEMRMRENMGAAAPVARSINGKPVLVALPGRPNTIPFHSTAPADTGKES